MDVDAARQMFDRAVEEEAPEFERFFLSKFFGLEFTYRDDETLRIDLPVRDFMFNPRHSLHGGVTMFVFDISMGHLCNHFLSRTVTLEMKTQFFHHITAECYFISNFLKQGRTIVAAESRLYDADDRLAAHATGTFFRTG